MIEYYVYWTLRLMCIALALINVIGLLVKFPLQWHRWPRDTRLYALGLLALFLACMQSFVEVMMREIPPGPRTILIFIALFWTGLASLITLCDELPKLMTMLKDRHDRTPR